MRRGWRRWEGRIHAEHHSVLKPDVAADILHKSGTCGFGQKYMRQMARVFSKLASPHEARVVSLGRQNISGVPFNIKARNCRRYPLQNGICEFGQNYMSQMARVFSKLASRHEARLVSLGRQNMSGALFNI